MMSSAGFTLPAVLVAGLAEPLNKRRHVSHRESKSCHQFPIRMSAGRHLSAPASNRHPLSPT